jgi:hypothetical protein
MTYNILLEAKAELDIGTVRYNRHTGEVWSVGAFSLDRWKYIQSLCDDPDELRFEMLPYNGATYMPAIPKHAAINVAEQPEYDYVKEQYVVTLANPLVVVRCDRDYYTIGKLEGYVYVVFPHTYCHAHLAKLRERRTT